MTWENLEENLKKALNVKISFPSGEVWLPDKHLTIDEWLTSAAQTDDELNSLNIPRIEFLRNRWPIKKLIQLRWEDPPDERSIWVMYAGTQTYILFSDGAGYQVIASIAPGDQADLFRAVVGKLLKNPTFVPSGVASIKSFRPDLIPVDEDAWTNEVENGAGAPAVKPGTVKETSEEESFAKLLIKWVRLWIDFPALGFWHEDIPESIKSVGDGEYVLRYGTPEAQRSKTDGNPEDPPDTPGRRVA